MAKTIDRVKQDIRERLEQIESERDQLLKALEALSGTPTSVGARRGRPVGSGRKASAPGKRAAGRRAPRGQRRQQVIESLQGGEKGPSAIAKEIGDVNPTQISGLLRQLASEGVVSRTPGGKWRLSGVAQPQASSPAPAPEPVSEAPASDAPVPAGIAPSE